MVKTPPFRALTLACVIVANAITAVPIASADDTPPVVVFDGDMGYDDVAALAYLVQEDRLGRIDLRAVTVVNNGLGYPGRAIRNARCLLERLGARDVEVADGANTAPNAFPAELRDLADRVVSSVTPGCTATEEQSETPAHEVIRRTVSDHPAARVIATGPLTNVARAGNVRHVIAMGGAIHVPGGLCCGAPPGFDNTQEFNLWVDPVAARSVVATTPKLRLVPLDATNHAPVTREFIDRLGEDHDTTAADLVLELISHPELKGLVDDGELFWWDAITAAAAVHDDLVRFRPGRLDVITSGPSTGRAVLTRDGNRARYGAAGDGPAFERRFLDSLNGRR
ncbi:inosine-uridine nucleoside N-ribohydrolase [Herbihabitans rhizosphaerae]|uniref:Inosine-uridine nucleoside N-ribohydrolase n=1 Tax=Herbihabitans rhizosphaerae TaxID=1872711 RepID=A0A4Q7KW28_9PSEU|nr:nucleoside hydrolase [Herbihabitans rhizosphaerae]RZS41268.1 inosine-uridine nucleoside N-ribohydrolase [Herbihabitans rhizosphaerae]